ncbi:MAG: hypothetical protein ACRDQ7_19910 [Haloechinothrix sp.]
MSTTILALLAVGLTLLGSWGRRNAETLAPQAMPEGEKRHRTTVLRRGGLACHAVAVLFAVAGVVSLL